ncbi:MAG: amidohydrolase family protein, partial [Methyloceanibacter sp.]
MRHRTKRLMLMLLVLPGFIGAFGTASSGEGAREQGQDRSILTSGYGFCAASVRALYVRAAAAVLAAQAQTAEPEPPVVRVPDVAPTIAAPGTVPPAPNDRVTVFTAKKFVTMDPGWPEATAVAVQDGRILSVGSLDDLKPWLDKLPHDIDDRFADKVLYPGFIEPHGHPLLGGIALSRPPLTYFPLANPYGPPFPGVKSKEEATAKLKEYVADAKSPDDAVIAWGYDIVAMGGHIDRDFLDSITKTQPLIVWDASEHFVYANSAAIEKYGMTPEVVAKTLGAGKRPDGQSNGQFLGVIAAETILLKPLQSLLAPNEALKIMKYLADLGQQAGITMTGDLMFGGINLEVELALAKAFFDRPDALARVVPVVDGATFAKTYGEQAIQKALDLK